MVSSAQYIVARRWDESPPLPGPGCKSQSVIGIAVPDGRGLVAASSTLDTGFGFLVLPMRHVGTTSWALLAAQRANPFQA